MARTLNPEDLRKPCDPNRFRFANTSEVAPLTRIVGQGRALDAIDFGLDMRSLGFNIYVLGESGTGKTSAIRSFVSEKAKADPVPPDRAYVFNFREPEEPIALSLPPGRGGEFQGDMRELVDYLRSAIPKVFDSKEYERQKGRIVEGFQGRQKEIFGTLE
ncbi:MAG: ATP-dependent protease La, partial [Deltaproteobacteria bacterium]|nr:ATP-dependent protease La [Deltaproteobacteria bacterium]